MELLVIIMAKAIQVFLEGTYNGKYVSMDFPSITASEKHIRKIRKSWAIIQALHLKNGKPIRKVQIK